MNITFYNFKLLKPYKFILQYGYILYNKGKIYSNTIFFDEAPRKGDRTYIILKFSMERPTTVELKQRINMFLEGLTH